MKEFIKERTLSAIIGGAISIPFLVLGAWIIQDARFAPPPETPSSVVAGLLETQPPTSTSAPTKSPTSTVTRFITPTPVPTEPATDTPTPTLIPTDTPIPSDTPTSTSTPIPTDTPLPTSTPLVPFTLQMNSPLDVSSPGGIEAKLLSIVFEENEMVWNYEFWNKSNSNTHICFGYGGTYLVDIDKGNKINWIETNSDDYVNGIVLEADIRREEYFRFPVRDRSAKNFRMVFASDCWNENIDIKTRTISPEIPDEYRLDVTPTPSPPPSGEVQPTLTLDVNEVLQVS